jgi:hypothetical protein
MISLEITPPPIFTKKGMIYTKMEMKHMYTDEQICTILEGQREYQAKLKPGQPDMSRIMPIYATVFDMEGNPRRGPDGELLDPQLLTEIALEQPELWDAPRDGVLAVVRAFQAAAIEGRSRAVR